MIQDLIVIVFASPMSLKRGTFQRPLCLYSRIAFGIQYTRRPDFAIFLSVMNQIYVLPDLVIDQIAAGEVLEQPASAVKELVENALDAGAHSICITIEAGGLQKILIEDDGSGMDRANVSLCLKRHATSKIRTADDLQKLMTMGFRGEALAAIAAVSRLALTTSNGIESTQVLSEGGESVHIFPSVRNRGTSIEVRNLFFNTPARLKFQKSPSACAASVLKTLQTIALAHPQVSFDLISNGRTVFSCRSCNWKKRIAEVSGDLAHEIHASRAGIVVRGMIGLPQQARVNRGGQTLFVNGRPIQSHLISRAVKEGFGTRIDSAMHPLFVLFLEMAPDAVDVNVHPQKREVRFRDEGLIYTVVKQAIENSFAQAIEPIAAVPWEFTPISQTPFVLCDAPLPNIETQTLPIVDATRIIALLGDFLLVEDRSWKLIDLRGAEARILFERMEQGRPPLQQLMWPHEMDAGFAMTAEEMQQLLAEVGIEARALSKKKLAVDALPYGMEISHLEAFIAQFAVNKTHKRLAVALTRTCRASSKPITLEEGRLIWENLQRCQDRQYDPLGKKIIAPINEELLAELFV